MLGEGGAIPPGAGEPRSAHPAGRLSAAPQTTEYHGWWMRHLNLYAAPNDKWRATGCPRALFCAVTSTYLSAQAFPCRRRSHHHPGPPHGPVPTSEPPWTESHSTVRLFSADPAADTGTTPPVSLPPGHHTPLPQPMPRGPRGILRSSAPEQGPPILP